jgi:hypothetical protein
MRMMYDFAYDWSIPLYPENAAYWVRHVYRVYRTVIKDHDGPLPPTEETMDGGTAVRHLETLYRRMEHLVDRAAAGDASEMAFEAPAPPDAANGEAEPTYLTPEWAMMWLRGVARDAEGNELGEGTLRRLFEKLRDKTPGLRTRNGKGKVLEVLAGDWLEVCAWFKTAGGSGASVDAAKVADKYINEVERRKAEERARKASGRG